MSLASDWGRIEPKVFAHRTAQPSRQGGTSSLPEGAFSSAFSYSVSIKRRWLYRPSLWSCDLLLFVPSPLFKLVGISWRSLSSLHTALTSLKTRHKRNSWLTMTLALVQDIILPKFLEVPTWWKGGFFPSVFLGQLVFYREKHEEEKWDSPFLSAECSTAWLQKPDLKSLPSALAFCPVHPQRSSISKPSTPFHLVFWHFWHYPKLPGEGVPNLSQLVWDFLGFSTARPTPRETSGAGELGPMTSSLAWPSIVAS